jgi:hypothetical protein
MAIDSDRGRRVTSNLTHEAYVDGGLTFAFDGATSDFPLNCFLNSKEMSLKSSNDFDPSRRAVMDDNSEGLVSESLNGSAVTIQRLFWGRPKRSVRALKGNIHRSPDSSILPVNHAKTHGNVWCSRHYPEGEHRCS